MKLPLLFLAVSLLVAQKTAPRIIHRVDAKYSDAAREAKISGTIRLALTVDETGLPADIRVVQALGYGLDENAIEAVSQWRFDPATENGKPVAVKCNVEMNFRLLNSPAP